MPSQAPDRPGKGPSSPGGRRGCAAPFLQREAPLAQFPSRAQRTFKNKNGHVTVYFHYHGLLIIHPRSFDREQALRNP